MEYSALLQAADRGQPPALVLLHGADEQLLDDALDLVARGLFFDASVARRSRHVVGLGSRAYAVRISPPLAARAWARRTTTSRRFVMKGSVIAELCGAR